MKKVLISIFTAIALVALVSCNVNTGNTVFNGIVDSGKCGDNMTWTVKEISPYNLELIFDGSGEMENFYDSDFINGALEGVVPWTCYKDLIRKITFSDGITSICNFAFYKMSNVKEIKLPKSLVVINPCAFEAMSFIEKLTIPASVKKIGSYCFKLTTIGNIVFEDPDGWMYCTNGNDWSNETNGTACDITENIKETEGSGSLSRGFFKK